MSSLSKEQLRARLRLNHRLALSQSSDNRKPPPYFWRLRPIGSKRDSVETTNALEDSKFQVSSNSTDTNSDQPSEVTYHSTKEKEAVGDQVETRLPGMNKQVEVPSRGQGSKLDVEDLQENRTSLSQNQETSTSLGTESDDINESRTNGGTLEGNVSNDRVVLEHELKRLQDILVQKDEQIKQKDSEIGYLRQVLGEIATAAHLAVQLESSYSFPATYYSAEDFKLYKSSDKQLSYPAKRGFHSQPRPENSAFYISAQTEADMDALDTRVSNSSQAMKQSESISNHSWKDRKHRLSLPVDSLGLSGPDTAAGSRHKASSLTGDTISLRSIPSESDSLQNEMQQQHSNDVVPPSPRIAQLRIEEDCDGSVT